MKIVPQNNRAFSFVECTTPAVGMETGKILDYQITASSEISPASLGRLNGRFAWCPLTEVNEYIQVRRTVIYVTYTMQYFCDLEKMCSL